MSTNTKTKGAVRAALSVTEFCDAYRVSRNTTYAAIKSGALKAKQVGRKKIIPVAAANEWLNGLPTASWGEA